MASRVNKPQKIPAVVVTWHDAHSANEWAPMDEALDTMTNHWECKTLGWLVHKDKQCTVLAMTLARNGEKVLQTISVPNGMIKKIGKLRYT